MFILPVGLPPSPFFGRLYNYVREVEMLLLTNFGWFCGSHDFEWCIIYITIHVKRCFFFVHVVPSRESDVRNRFWSVWHWYDIQIFCCWYWWTCCCAWQGISTVMLKCYQEPIIWFVPEMIDLGLWGSRSLNCWPYSLTKELSHEYLCWLYSDVHHVCPNFLVSLDCKMLLVVLLEEMLKGIMVSFWWAAQSAQ